MTRGIKKSIIKEDGAVQILEATIVFPVMFFVLFLLIYFGNAYYIKAQVESVVETAALKGANYSNDPILESIRENGTIPSLNDLDVKPYRYIFGNVSEVESQIDREVRGAFGDKKGSFFKNMKPKMISGDCASFNNYVVYSTFSVDTKYTIQFPIRFLGADSPTILTINSRAEVPVQNTVEFIRNTDMAIDLFAETKAGDAISQAFGKIRNFLSEFAKM